MMKRKLLTAMASLLLWGCTSTASVNSTVTPKPTSTAAQVKVLTLKGPTSMGLVKFMDEASKIDTNHYQFEIAGSIDEVVPKISKGEIDIATVPANLASVLYHNTKGQIQVLGINTLGVLYIVTMGDQNITSMKDLAGKTIYASGKGATPEYVLQYLLAQNNVTDAKIEWKSEHAECVAALAKDPAGIAMLPQPFVTAAQAKQEKIQVSIDLTKEWDKVNPTSSLVTGVVVARKEFIEQYPEVIDEFLMHYDESVKFVNENQDVAAKLIGNFGIVPEPVAKKALPYCNIVLVIKEDMKNKLEGYLKVLLDQNPKAVGGQLPDNEFYYGIK